MEVKKMIFKRDNMSFLEKGRSPGLRETRPLAPKACDLPGSPPNRATGACTTWSEGVLLRCSSDRGTAPEPPSGRHHSPVGRARSRPLAHHGSTRLQPDISHRHGGL
ncbi:hypothetical protein ElyMa_000004300 [Elysia marginata]|uniref:Uncharacterized protein n=1 Tax=Elysia marginata TaxID=1093978 RepID=A0AAV4EA82_9GAST|nr:hypothetical protein ElyMa_000004300 [Elysia marginata]